MKNKKTLEKIANELMSLIGTKAKITVTQDKGNDALVVKIEAGDETGLLIGRRGETLASLQMILGMALKQETGEWTRVIVDIGDYKKKEEDYLNSLAESAAKKAKETGDPQPLYNLTAAQRRVVHLALSSDKGVTTESVGEGKERYLVVKPK